jgi:hypothetical protein
MGGHTAIVPGAIGTGVRRIRTLSIGEKRVLNLPSYFWVDTCLLILFKGASLVL